MKTIFVPVAICVLGLLLLSVDVLAAEAGVTSSAGNAAATGSLTTTAAEKDRVDGTAPSRRPASGSANPETEYRVGPQDLIEVSVYGLPELARTVRVNSEGKISLPLIGQVEATGLTAQGLERSIANKLSEKYLQNPQVTIFIKEFTTLRFTVEGAVNKPGVFPIVGQMTLLRALAVAGGQGPLSDMTEIIVFRVTPAGESVSLKFDATKIRTGEIADPLIQSDDLVVVNRSKARAAFKDSLFRDILDVLNPIPFLR
jgi:polysaccharide export outer membrane protein